MTIFPKRKHDELDDLTLMTEDEQGAALVSLENRLFEINEEIESIMAAYARLTKNRKISRRRFKHDWRRDI